jgi:primase-polymerase (primpol)-like protein
MYDSGRYFTVTGKHLSGTPLAIQDRQELVNELQKALFVPLISPAQPKIGKALGRSDEELIERAKNARNGERFRRLWEGDASDYGNDNSRADLALCRTLVFWCGGDTERIDRLFRRSGLMRDKWDRQTGDASYGDRTVRAAIQGI